MSIGKNKVKSIHDFGQSIWLDLLDREIMDTGALKKLITEDGVRGLTSNPAIFEKAISNSTAYDEDIAAFSKQTQNLDDLFYRLAVKDIKRAADIFKSVYEESDGEDGFVSLEVSPHLAHDTEATIKQARELWNSVDRKNAMIKIPGTAAALPAIRQCIAEGININVTLLFGLPRYMAVTEAYLSGLEDRLSAYQAIDHTASVASFFLSRIDVMVDPILKEKGLSELQGEVAIASARKAYEIYQQVFHSDRFNKLQARGAKRQRLLWASTSSKNPAFSDVKYVEALIGKETINTLPMETLEAFRDHGSAASRLEDHLDKATRILSLLQEKGILLDDITQKLEDEGVEKFIKPYEQLLREIGKQKSR